MRNALLSAVLVVAAGVSFALPAAADEPGKPASARAPGAPVAVGAAVTPKSVHGLTRVHGALTSNASSSAGVHTGGEVSARGANAPKPVRPAPSPRVLRRMNADRVMVAVNESVRACASESTSAAKTAFGLRVSVGPKGEVESAELVSSQSAPSAPVLSCVVKAVSAARFGAPGAAGAAIAVPVEVPGHVAVATADEPAAATGPVATNK